MGTRLVVAATWIGALSLFAVGVWRSSPRATPRPPASSALARSLNPTGPDNAPWRWSVTYAQGSQGALIIEADIVALAQSMEAARAIVEPLRERYGEVLLYFRPAGTVGTSAARRVQWTPGEGYRELILR